MSFAPPPAFPQDDDNPYAPPMVDLHPKPATPGPLGSQPFAVSDVVNRAWEIFKDRLGMCLAVVFGIVGLNMIVSVGTNVLEAGLMAARVPQWAVVLVQLVLALFGMAISFWLTAGQTIAFLNIARARRFEYGVVFSGGPYLVPIVLASLVYGLGMAGVALACLLPAGAVALATGGQGSAAVGAFAFCIFLAVLFAIIVSIRLSQYIYLIVDRGVGPIESLRLSNQITRGREGAILGVGLICFAINVAGFLMCFVGLIFTAPLSVLILAVLYTAMTGTGIGATPLRDLEFDDFS